jgi:hypothetical protein
MVCRASHTGIRFLVRTPHLGTFFEVTESLMRGSRFVGRDACASPAVSQCRIPNRSVVFGRTLYNSLSAANGQGFFVADHER